MRYLNYFFIVLFILSAALQYNDPDPYIWMPIYLYGAWLCYKANKGEFRSALFYAGLAVYIIYGLVLFTSETGVLSWATEHDAESITQTMKAEKPWIEETREFGGLLLLCIALGLNIMWLKRFH